MEATRSYRKSVEPPEVARDYKPIHPGTDWRDVLRRLFAPILVVLGAVAKYGFAFAKFGSIFIALGGYALLWGWQFGVGIVALLLVHELGHFFEARRQGLHPALPVFIPFLGAYVSFKNENLSPWRHAWIALAGPFTGSLGAAAFWAAGEATNSLVLKALGYTGFLLNLFNLIPVVPLDGGRAASALHPAFWFLGLFAVALLAFHYQNPFFFIVLAFVCFEVYRRWEQRKTLAARAYHAVTWPQRAVVFAVYIGLVVGLVAGMHAAHVTVQY
jgi:Zn-dependent protease